MKKWTVMLIPHDRGNTRTLNLSGLHIWAVVALMVALTFSTAFLYRRQEIAQDNTARLEQAYTALKQNSGPIVIDRDGISKEEHERVVRQLQEDYEKSVSTITTRLNELYETENEVRSLTGLGPRKDSAIPTAGGANGGVGGPPTGLSDEIEQSADGLMRPPQVIYGLLKPSADLILQEINIRSRSLVELVEDIEAREDQMQRTPTIWPTSSSKRYISSAYGNRRDPFTRQRSWHNGTDIVAPLGTDIYSTARGKVVEVGHDRYKGNFVCIDHGVSGFETTYMHLKRAAVHVGDSVERGDTIGYLGNSGRSTGPHLHYEISYQGRSVNPEKHLGN